MKIGGTPCVRPFIFLLYLHLTKFLHVVLFFFQAEDGIRDATVTEVQTCALPILSEKRRYGSQRFVLGQLRAVGARHRDRFIEDCNAQRLYVVAPKHRLSLQRERRDWIGNGIDQQLPPRQRREIAAQKNAE